MTKIVCELCGSNDVIKQDGFYVCQHCGTKYSIEEAKKLIGTVRIDRQEESKNLLTLARRARDEGNSQNAEKYYGSLAEIDPNNWEAAFFQVYYQSMQTNLMNLESALHNLTGAALSAIELLSKSDDNNKAENVNTVITYTGNYSFSAATLAQQHWQKFKEVDGSDSEYKDRAIAAYAILKLVEDKLKECMPDDKENIKYTQLLSLKFINTFSIVFNSQYKQSEITRLNSEIKAYDPTFEPAPVTQSSGCYIATAVYGSYDCPEVWVLRRYRDNILAKSVWGRTFVHVYYAVSPTIVKMFGRTSWFNKFWRTMLDAKTAELQKKGISSDPYFDREW